MAALTVGFDLDLTLVDTRAGVVATLDALAAETGVPLDAAGLADRLGPPLETLLAPHFPPERLGEVADRFRALYPDHAIAPAHSMPGAHEALAAVRRAGGRTLVVTGKHLPNAALHVEALGLDVDELVGGVWGVQKGAALRAHGASVYVGDHVHDVEGAREAGALSVSVPTGGCDADELRAAGTDVVLADLTGFPGWLDEHLLDVRLAALEAELCSYGSVLVAYSGGADSALLLAAAVRALGPERVAAATGHSDSLPQVERGPAAELADMLGVRLLTPRTHEMEREGYRANAGDRCYFCKAELLEVLGPLAAAEGLAHVATGTNADDAVAGFRPGIRAAAERGARTPLLDAGLTKQQVRAASRRWGLPTWDKPAAACLSSRIAYGIEVSPHRLARVERAEAALRSLLPDHRIEVRDLRVRDLGERGRVEIDLATLASLRRRPEVADAVLAAVRDAGFDEVELDPRGFRSGSMNELLADPAQHR